MEYEEAFRRMGYRLVAPRQDWTAERDDGVCLTLWRSEIDWQARPISMDTRRNAGPVEDWAAAGNNKRKRHLATAIDQFDGWVDAIIVDRVPGRGADKSTPWNVKDRQGMRWRVRDLDPTTGHFIAEALPFA